MVVLEPLLWRLEARGSYLRDLRCGRGVTAYADDVPIIVSCEGQLLRVEESIKRYKAVSRAKVN